MKKKLIYVTILLISYFLFFLLGRFYQKKSADKIKIELENSLNLTTLKVQNLIDKNSEMEKIISSAEKNIIDIKQDNEKIYNKLSKINKINESMKDKLMEFSEINISILDKLEKLEKNQDIIKHYIMEIEHIIEED